MLEIEKLSNTEKEVYQALKKVIDPEQIGRASCRERV